MSPRYDKLFTFILQGPFHKNTEKAIDIYHQYGKVVLSTWGKNYAPYMKLFKRYADLYVELTEESPELKALCNDFGNNLPRQLETTINGFKHVDTDLVIKTRTDEYFSGISIFLNKVLENPEKYTTCNIFFINGEVPEYNKLFHPSDHLIGGNSKTLRAGFEAARSKLNEFQQSNLSIEGWLFSNWLERSDKNISGKSNIKVLREFSECVDIDLMKPYKWCCAGIEYGNSDYLYNNGYNVSLRNLN